MFITGAFGLLKKKLITVLVLLKTTKTLAHTQARMGFTNILITWALVSEFSHHAFQQDIYNIFLFKNSQTDVIQSTVRATTNQPDIKYFSTQQLTNQPDINYFST